MAERLNFEICEPDFLYKLEFYYISLAAKTTDISKIFSMSAGINYCLFSILSFYGLSQSQ